MESSGNEHFREFEAEKRAVSSLRAELNTAGEKLDEFFRKRQEIGQGIATRLRRVKALREERNALTTEVKQHKEERKRLQDGVKVKIEGVRKLRNQRDTIQQKLGFRGSPASLQQEIARMEFRIETEGMSFDAEQKLMKRIKELKKKAEEAHAIGAVQEQAHAAEKGIRELKEKTDEEHLWVQKKAEESQQKHEEMVLLLKEVDGLRKQEKAVEGEMGEIKKKYDEVKKKLEEGLVRLNDLGKKVREIKGESERKRREQHEADVESMSRSVEEKLKKGEKLTTEDLLAWQAKEGKG